MRKLHTQETKQFVGGGRDKALKKLYSGAKWLGGYAGSKMLDGYNDISQGAKDAYNGKKYNG